MPKHVLLIEDKQKQLDQWVEEFGIYDGLYIVVCANSTAQAMEVFPQQQWDAIVIDGCLDGDHFDSPPLIKWLKERVTPRCVLIAASSNPDLGQLMVEAGCTRAAFKKDDAPGLIHSILRRQPQSAN